MLKSVGRFLVPALKRQNFVHSSFRYYVSWNNFAKSIVYPFLRSRGLPNIKFRPIHNAQAIHKKARVDVVLVMSDGRRIPVHGKEGDSILDVIIKNEVDIKGFGACEGTVSCSTCHVMFSSEDFKRLPAISVEEEDVLDMAEDVTSLSRLGCQVQLSQKLEGLEIKVPEKIKDIRHNIDDDDDA